MASRSRIGSNYAYGFDVNGAFLDALLKSANKYEQDLYSQLVRLNEPDKYNDGKQHKVRGFSRSKLKELLQTHDLTWGDDEKLDLQTSTIALDELVDYVELATQHWLETTKDGTDFFEAGGFAALLGDIKAGGFKVAGTDKIKQLSKPRLDGLKKELIIGLKRAGWAYNLDENSVIVESNGFKNERYPEGSLDFLIKFDKESTNKKSRRPMAFEAKSNINDFSVGAISATSIKKMLTPTKVETSQDGSQVRVYLSAKAFSEAADKIFIKKYLHGRRDYGGMNTPIFEGYDGSIMLFSEFIEDIKSRGIGIRDYGNTGPDFTVSKIPMDNFIKQGETYTEELLKNRYREIMTKNRSMQVWYGK